MSSFKYQALGRQRFHQPSDAPAQVAHARDMLRLLLAQDGSTTRLCETIAGGPVSLHVLEQQIGASSRTIGRIFQRETGMRYQQWRQQWRLMRAIELLATGRSLSYCAFQLGFASDSAFIAFFKSMTGSTPGQWLK